ncbi:MAG: PBSX family phage terminase, large subunit [Parcubacteria group bacterium GW2011_GWB1_40_14]|nr:MAG: PBSX family phage terminase, large subunit [Parcubacteria group bacterium GW2011_GWB1_40_14]
MADYRENTALKKLFQLQKKIRDVGGGTGASKTVGILIWLIDYAQSFKKVIDVVAESYPHLEQGSIREFKNIMIDRKYWNDDRWNESKHLYTFETGSTLQFQSYDKLGKAHGPRRDVLFLNEGNWLPWNIVDQLITRTRDVVWVDYNPVAEFWMHTEILGKRNDVESLKLTYLDNECLSEAERQEIEGRKGNSRWWRVYGEGELGEAEGRIYTGWKLIDEIPHEARYEGPGLDFGYDPDPAAIINVYYLDGGYILDEVLYGTRLDNRMLATTLKNLPPALTVADSAEPKSIDEIKSFGVNIIGTPKGADSVRYGVKTLQAQRISVTKRSLNLIREYRNFFQAVDKRTNVPIMGQYEGECHALDAARYKICSLIPIIQRKEMLAQIPKLPPRARTNPAL